MIKPFTLKIEHFQIRTKNQVKTYFSYTVSLWYPPFNAKPLRINDAKAIVTAPETETINSKRAELKRLSDESKRAASRGNGLGGKDVGMGRDVPQG